MGKCGFKSHVSCTHGLIEAAAQGWSALFLSLDFDKTLHEDEKKAVVTFPEAHMPTYPPGI